MPARASVARPFRDIREWDGSKARAFEELCYQLRDPVPDGSGAQVIKTRPPDAGAEWYWQFPDGEVRVWQVKYIPDIKILLDEMRGSLKTVVDKRPTATQVTFCIPEELTDDPSGSTGKLGRQRYEAAKTRWKRDVAPNVTIHLVDGGELRARLSREEHRGREWFFFQDRILGQQWCADELKGTIDDAGDRYTPEQDVALPIDRVLEAVGHPADFARDAESRRNDLLRTARKQLKRTAPQEWEADIETIRQAFAAFERVSPGTVEPPTINRHEMLAALGGPSQALTGLTDRLDTILWEDPPERSGRPRRKTNSKNSAEEKAHAARQARRSSAERLSRSCGRLAGAVWDFKRFLNGTTCEAAGRRALFIKGAAGRGKTHLCCDVGERLLAQGHPVLVMLGERFLDPSPWTTLARMLGEPNLSPPEIAQVLAASGEAAGKRAVVLIDALNDTPTRGVWAAELSDIRRRLTASPWVALAVTCRTSYLDLVEPRGGADKGFVTIDHPGYRGREFEATERIFAAHKIEQPRVPLLLPDFSDPLFLKLYCEGLRDSREKPTGSEHLSRVFERFAHGRSERIEQRLGLDPHLHVVDEAVRAFATRLAEQGLEHLDYSAAQELINRFAPQANTYPDTLLQTMAAEGLLAVDRRYSTERGEPGEVVSFPYQRFSDHLLLKAFLADRIDQDASPGEVVSSFAAGQLGEWLAGAPAGAIEALAVQLPERWGVEILDAHPRPEADDYRAQHRQDQIWDAFIASIVARDRSAFTDRTAELINDALSRRPSSMIDALISVAPDPMHPFSADRQHRFLSKIPMAARDAFWGIPQYNDFGDPTTALDRLIRWAARGPYPSYPPDVIALAALTLSWVLGSSNRFARDYTTKAIASLYIGQIRELTTLIERFADVDDPYIKQRLAAAALGAVTRTGAPNLDPDDVTAVVLCLTERLLEADGQLPDILLRDHVNTLAEWSRRRRLISAPLAKRAANPPAAKPPKTPRTKSYLESKYERAESREDGYGSLLFSALFKESDWSRYVVSRRVEEFLATRLGDPVPEPKREPEAEIDPRRWAAFVAALRPYQTAQLSDDEDVDWTAFSETLDVEQRGKLLNAVTKPKRRSRVVAPPRAFPAERAMRFIFQRCIELGWTPELFGHFDYSVGRQDRGRDNHKPERFGKKYQWIAFHELIARLADNFTFRSWDATGPYPGAAEQTLRDVDPTIPPERITVGDDQSHEHSTTFPQVELPAWWGPPEPDFDPLESGREGEWAAKQSDLAAPEQLITVTDQKQTRWVIAEGHVRWAEDPEEAPSVVAGDGPDRDLAITWKSTVVRARDLGRLRAWLGESRDLYRSVPDLHSQGVWEAHFADLPDLQDRFGHHGGWRRRGHEGRLPVSSAATVLGYSATSSGFDCSVTQTASCDVPARTPAELCGLRFDERAGGWVGPGGDVDARYWETSEGFHRWQAFMFREEALGDMLREHKLALAVGLYCERRVFDRESRSLRDPLGWVDYTGHAIFDGDTWEFTGLDVFEVLHPQAEDQNVRS